MADKTQNPSNRINTSTQTRVPIKTPKDDVTRALPSSNDVEKAILSCIFQSEGSLLDEAVQQISPECFYNPALSLIYETIIDLYTQSKTAPIDLISITQKLTDRKQIEQAGGAATITELINFIPTTANFSHYLSILREKYTLRQIIHSCTQCIQLAYEDPEHVETLVDDVERKVLAIRSETEKGTVRSMKEEVLSAIEVIETISNNPGDISGIPSGLKDLDSMTNGFHAGEMIIIAARPSMGKTSLAMNMVEHAAIEGKFPVAVFSLEMSTQQLVLRLLCSRAGIDMQKVRSGFLSQRDHSKLMEAANALAHAPIFIDDTPSISILELRAKARRLHKAHGIKMIAVDYIQLLRSTSRRAQDNRQLEIAEISSGLKALAKELSLPVITLAQLNRNPEQRGGGKPRLSDLRESGSIEQDADFVGLLVREDYYANDEEEREEKEGKAELIVAKQRNGPTGEVPMTFIHQYMRFVNRAKETEEEL